MPTRAGLSMALVALVTLGAACKKTARKPAGKSPGPVAARDAAVPVVVVTPDAGVPGALPLTMDELEAGCIGFTSAGDGVLVLTHASDRTANGEFTHELGFAMLDVDATPPFAAESWSYAEGDGPQAEVEAAAEYASQVGALNTRIQKLGLLRCDEHADNIAHPGGKEARVELDKNQIFMTVAGQRRMVRQLVVGDQDGMDHEGLDAVYSSAGSPLVLLWIGNSDTGLSQDRPFVVRAR